MEKYENILLELFEKRNSSLGAAKASTRNAIKRVFIEWKFFITKKMKLFYLYSPEIKYRSVVFNTLLVTGEEDSILIRKISNIERENLVHHFYRLVNLYCSLKFTYIYQHFPEKMSTTGVVYSRLFRVIGCH